MKLNLLQQSTKRGIKSGPNIIGYIVSATFAISVVNLIWSAKILGHIEKIRDDMEKQKRRDDERKSSCD